MDSARMLRRTVRIEVIEGSDLLQTPFRSARFF
jgi:hypothetical protein